MQILYWERLQIAPLAKVCVTYFTSRNGILHPSYPLVTLCNSKIQGSKTPHDKRYPSVLL